MMGAAPLAERVAIITGAGRGIGRAVAEMLAGQGATVVLAARTRSELAAVAEAVRGAGGRALAVPTDVTQDAHVGALVDQTVGQFGRVDILVTAAGVAAFGPVSAAKPEDWDSSVSIQSRNTVLVKRSETATALTTCSGGEE